MSTKLITIRTSSDYKDFVSFINDPEVKVLNEEKDLRGMLYIFNTDDTIYVPDRFLEKKKSKVSKEYKTILTDVDRQYLNEYIDCYDILAFDTETTGLNTRQDEIIGFSVSGKEGTGLYFPIKTWKNGKLVTIESNNSQMEYFLNKLIDKKLITWNGSFDVRFVKNQYGIDLIGSIYIDGQLLKHTLEEEGVFSLKEVAVSVQSYIGFDVEDEANKEQIILKENVAKNGGSTTKTNYEMYKADLEVMAPYACSDADLTLRVVNYYLRKLKEESLEEFFFVDEVMPLYREVTIPMELRGVKLDMDLLKSSKKEIVKDISSLEKKIKKSLFNLDEVYNWYCARVEKHTKETPRGKYGQGVVEHYKLDLPMTKAGKYSTSKAAVQKLPNGEGKSFLLGNVQLDPGTSFSIKEKIYLKDNDNEKINITSKTQLKEIVFDYLKEKPLSKTPKGSPQFNDDMVDSLEGKYEFIKHLHNYNKLSKIESSYINRFLERQEDGYYYFSYKQHGTISGRYGSDAQQLPRPLEEGQEDKVVLKYNNRIRAFFISEKNRIFIDSDFESLEPNVFAHVSGDEGLRNIFRKGHDFYSTIAIDTEGLYEYSADKKADNYLGLLNKQKRQDAKDYSLGIPYGMTGYALGKTLDISTEEADELVSGYLDSYPSLDRWMKDSKRKAQKEGLVSSEAGRVRHLPMVKKLYNIYGDKLLDFKYRRYLLKSMEQFEILKIYRDYKNGVNNSRNFQIQSLAASIVNRAAIAINRVFKEKGLDAWCCAQVHDQLIFNVPLSLVDECKVIVEDLMQNTTKLSLELRAPAVQSINWRDGH